MLAEELHLSLEDRCNLTADVQGSLDWAVWEALLRKVGYDEFGEIRGLSLGSHMDVHFQDGLRKLEIPAEYSDPMRCAMYHVYSNALGGCKMSYIVESVDKVWVFYNMQGISHALLRPDAWLKQMRSWHGREGEAIGNPGVAWIATHFTELGDPYRAGYFVDFHRELKREERFQVSVGENPPPGLPMLWPEYDESKWPAERRMKALRNYYRGYASSTILSVARTQSPELTADIVELAMRTVLFAMNDRLISVFGLAEVVDPVERVALFIANMEEITGTTARVTVSDGSARLEVATPSAFAAGQWRGASEELMCTVAAALGRAWSVWASYMAPEVSVAVSPDCKTWEIVRRAGGEAAEDARTVHGDARLTEEQLLALT